MPSDLKTQTSDKMAFLLSGR